MREQMLYFGGIYGKRLTDKEKARFANFAGKRIADLGYPIRLDSRKNGRKRTCNNLLIGDVKKADVIVTVPYDTASKVLIPGYCYYPLDRKKNMTVETANAILQSLLAVAMLLFYYILIFRRSISGSPIECALSFLGMAFVVFAALKLAAGISNKYNFNRNSASIVVLMSLLQSLEKQKRIAFVMTDRTCNSYEGYRRLAACLGEKAREKEIIMLDCIGADEFLFFVCRQTAAKEKKERLKCCSGDLKIRVKELPPEAAEETALYFFPGGVYVLGGREEKGDIVVTNTRSRKDSEVNLDKLEQVRAFLTGYLS